MNIFVLDEDPIVAAKMYCDIHLPKMVVELYQQLGSSVITLYFGTIHHFAFPLPVFWIECWSYLR